MSKQRKQARRQKKKLRDTRINKLLVDAQYCHQAQELEQANAEVRKEILRDAKRVKSAPVAKLLRGIAEALLEAKLTVEALRRRCKIGATGT